MTVVSVDQIKVGIKKFIEMELASKANGVTKFLIYFVLPSIDKETQNMINIARENTLFSSLFDENGQILLDDVYMRASEAINKTGKIVIDKFGISLDRTDIEKLYQYIRGV